MQYHFTLYVPNRLLSHSHQYLFYSYESHHTPPLSLSSLFPILFQVKSFNDSLQEIEDNYRRELVSIDRQQQNKAAHAALLENEMSSALIDLQALVHEGRGYIAKEVNLVCSVRNTVVFHTFCLYSTPPIV